VLTSACIVEGVRKLPAAHYLLVERGRPLQPEPYWDLAPHFADKRRYRSEAEATEALSVLLEDAVGLRLVSDVPLGAFLSGGIDSATIVAAMARVGQPAAVKTFSIGFQEDSFNELAEARSTARFLGIDHHDKIVHADMAAALPRIVEAADEPFADTSIIPFYYLAEFARQHVTVSLSGDGSDEIFAGYETYTADRLLNATAWLPAWGSRTALHAVERFWPVSFDCVSLDYKARQFLRGHSLGAQRGHYFWRTIFDDAGKRSILRPEWREDVSAVDTFDDFHHYYDDVAHCHFLDQAMYVDVKTWLVDDILVKVDRATMAHALEARAPFLDHRLIEFAAALPADWKLKRLRKKHLLRESQRRHLPARVIQRRKHGFNSPVSEWFGCPGPLADLAEAVTTDDTLAPWFEPTAIRALWREHRARVRDNGLALLGLTCLGLWLRQAA
jgi:asparagine synthase (glutamine-hydrolysing)